MKPLLVGETNPYQSDPRLAQRYALYPDPPRCAGWNLCHTIMQLDEGEYLRRFDRVNLCFGHWSLPAARQRAHQLQFDRRKDGQHVFVLFGTRVSSAFTFQFVPYTRHEKRWCASLFHYVILPHPSGLSRAWNEPGAYERARAVLREADVL